MKKHPVTKDHVLYDSICTKVRNREIYRDRKISPRLRKEGLLLAKECWVSLCGDENVLKLTGNGCIYL
jgi:hypothetical protein